MDMAQHDLGCGDAEMLIYRVEEHRVVQHRTSAKYLVPNGSQDAILIKFLFDGSWEDYPSKFVQFSKCDKTYNVMLNGDDACWLPAQLDEGEWSVGCFGIVPDQPGRRMTSVNSKLVVVPRQYNPDGIAPPPVDEDYYTMLFNQMKELATGVEQDSEEVREAKEFCGESREFCKGVIDDINGNMEQITGDVMEHVVEQVYTKVEISVEGEIALTDEDIDAIIGVEHGGD